MNSSYIAGETFTVSWLSVKPHRSRQRTWPGKVRLRQFVGEAESARADVGAVVVQAQQAVGLQVVELVEVARGR